MSRRILAPSLFAAATLGVFVSVACGNTSSGEPALARASRHDSPQTAPAPAADRVGATRSPSAAIATPGKSANDGPTDRPGGARRVVVQGVDLTGVGYDRGSATAPVVVVDFSDFGCPFCGSFARETYPAIDKEFVQTGKVFFKYVPFVMGMFPNGQQAARAAECAADQGGFWPMYERLYAAQADWKRSLAPNLLFQRYAAANKLDEVRFSSCYTGPEAHPRTKQANADADRLNIRATPTFFIDGRMLEGALPLPQFRQLLAGLVEQGR